MAPLGFLVVNARHAPAPLLTASALAEIERIICQLKAIDPAALPDDGGWSPRFCLGNGIRELESAVKLTREWEKQGRKGKK